MKRVINIYLMITLSIWLSMREKQILAKPAECPGFENKVDYSFYFEALIGKKVNIYTHDENKYKGRLLAVAGDSLIISNQKNESISIRINEIAAFRSESISKDRKIAKHIAIAACITIVSVVYILPRLLLAGE